MKLAHHVTTMLRATAVAASAAALAAPAAVAMTRGTTGDQSDVVSRYITNHGTPVQHKGVRLITDTLAPDGGGIDVVSRYVANHGAQAQQAGVRFITDTLAPGGGVVGAVSPSADDTSWWDTGVGFCAALVLLGIVLAARFLLQRRRAIVA
jgi:hypothetical protein